VLPFPDLTQHGIGDAAYQVERYPQPINIFKMGLDIAHRQSSCIEPDDIVCPPSIRVRPFFTSSGSKLPARSRGTASANLSSDPFTRLAVTQLRRLV
jgi:hypothetical protein